MPEPFRWQALLQRVTEPLFLLDRQRRVRFVNSAWEALTGMSAAEAHGLVCRRRRDVEPHTPKALAHALAPPAEVWTGQPSRARRLIPSNESPRRWWDVEFFPLRDTDGVCAILGKVTAVVGMSASAAAPLPEKLLALRERFARNYTFDSLTGASPAQRRLVDQARLASQTRVSVLLVGESGTGKEWTARVIHHEGTDRDRSFAALDCARLPASAITSALFGAAGLLRRASVGTLYLREIASLPRELQARLADTDSPGPRLIAGLSTDPAEEIRKGRLLEDLYAALSTLVLTLSPLRERSADLPILGDRILSQVNAETDSGGRRIAGLSPEAWESLREYRWPANLRELTAVLATAAERAKTETVEATDLPAYVRQAVRLAREPDRTPERPLPLVDLVEQVERRLITQALQSAKGNKSRAAELLSLGRAGLLSRMKRLGMEDGE